MQSWSAGLVRQFHNVFGLFAADRPTVPSDELAGIRQRLLEEEVGELAVAIQGRRLDEIARELADVVYVAYGTALTYGIDLDAVLAEIHRANMSKLGPDGVPVVRDGKVVKSQSFQPPDVAAVLSRENSEGLA